MWSVDYVFYNYDQVMAKAAPRMNQFKLMKSPFPTITLCLLYVYLAKFVGPKIMANRKAMNLSAIMIIYNYMMVILNTMFVVSGFYYSFVYGASLQCDTLDKHPYYMTSFNSKLTYYFYLLKLLEFGDTIFAVLRKKSNQLSNLHVLHHGSVPISVWIVLKFVPSKY